MSWPKGYDQVESDYMKISDVEMCDFCKCEEATTEHGDDSICRKCGENLLSDEEE